jgi:replication factor C small subunit|tara:strand:- start:6020 stop:6922 length:903 start_codon:yes stop_codon:yes gene_type:complete
MSTILSQKYAPTELSQVFLSPENAKVFNEDFKLEDSPNLLFIGSAGVGKTTLAKVLAKNYDYMYINASDESGIDTIRTKVMKFIKTPAMFGELKVVILDEADGLSSHTTGNGSSAQQALRGIIEDNLEYCRFILTANYAHKIIEPLESRMRTFNFSLSKKDVGSALLRILKGENAKFEKTDLLKHINAYFPDLRKCINELIIKDGVFSFEKNISNEIPVKVKTLLASGKVGVFDIRSAVIKAEDTFNGDYHIVMRGLYDLYCADSETKAVMAICHHMEKHAIVMDKEVNFTSLLLQLSQL